jgi:alkanesulfonate monooxygenase SsuD/methylene tetrahydromethanopterin reductase-like flavin-dependent oxidoreductase (luciferase family)
VSGSPTFGIPVPQVFMNGRPDMELVKNSLRRAEALGFESAWVQDQVAGQVPLMESVSLLCYAAAVTERIRLGVSVIVFPIRNAVQLAKNFSSLDNMSNGRAILGIGLGPVFAGDHYFKIFGTRSDEALRRFNEGLALMRALWSEERVDLDGEFYTLKQAAMEPKPIQQPLPVWFGGQHPKALRRAARVADGYMGAGPTTTGDFALQITQLKRFLDEQQRDLATFPISKRVYLAVDDDAARAKRGLDEFFQARYPWMIQSNPNFVADICAWGTPEQVADGLRPVLEAGAQMIVLNPLWDYVEQMERLAEEVIPLLRQ